MNYAGNKRDRKSTSRYCTYTEDNMVTWKSKKQNFVSHSSAEAKYRAITHTACEIV